MGDLAYCAVCNHRFTEDGQGQRSPFNEDVCWHCCENHLTSSATWRGQDEPEATASLTNSQE